VPNIEVQKFGQKQKRVFWDDHNWFLTPPKTQPTGKSLKNNLSSNFVELKLIEHDSMLIIMKTNNASNVNQSRTSRIKEY
jgi:hypothetical protein